MTKTKELLDRKGRAFDPELHEVTKKGKPLNRLGYLVVKKDSAPVIEVNELKNPELEAKKVYEDVVNSTETEDQIKAKIEREIKEKLYREKIEKDLRAAAEIERKKKAEMDATTIKYDIVEMKNWAQKRCSSVGGQFIIDTDSTGGMIGTWHAVAAGKSISGNFSYPENVMKRAINTFCNTFSMANAQTIDVPSIFGGFNKVPVINSIPQNSAQDIEPDLAKGEIIDFGG